MIEYYDRLAPPTAATLSNLTVDSLDILFTFILNFLTPPEHHHLKRQSEITRKTLTVISSKLNGKSEGFAFAVSEV